jgi:predicted MFS family arabinose efflux permease
VAPAFALNGLSFIVVIAALLRVDIPPRAPRTRRTTMLEDVAEGVGYAVRTSRIRVLLGIVLVVSLWVFNFNVFVPLLARQVLGMGALGFGFLMSVLGVGAVAGALVLAMVREEQVSIPAIFGTSVLACAATLAVAAVRHEAAAVPLLFVIGFAAIVTVAACNTSLQMLTPDALRGRIMSIYALVFSGTVPVGAFAVGAIAERWTVSVAFLVCGAAGLLCLLPLMVSWRVRALRAE